MSNINNIILHVTAVQDILKTKAFPNWRRSCEQSLKQYTGTSHTRKSQEEKTILDQLCTTPSYLDQVIINPLLNWLNTFRSILERRMALTKDATDKFIRDGVNYIYRFVVVLNYFAANPSIFVPSDVNLQTQTGRERFKRNQDLRREYRDSLNEHISELIGCSGELSTRLLGLSQGIASTYQEQVKDKIDYLSKTCTSIRFQKLK